MNEGSILRDEDDWMMGRTSISQDSSQIIELEIIPTNKNQRNNLSNTDKWDDDISSPILPTRAPKTVTIRSPATSRVSPRSMDFHQSRNHDLLCTQLFYLQPRAVLCVGSVLSVSFTQSTCRDNFLDDSSQLLFRVLFIEGGTQPMLFRCKTPVYTSSIASLFSSDSVYWDDTGFRFDMLMAEKESNTSSIVSGEVVVSVYKVKDSGGNELIGQTQFDLSKMAITGSVEHFGSGVEGRSLSGVYSLLSGSSNGLVVGDIEIQLNIAWKPLETIETRGNASESQQVVSKPRPKSSNATTVSKPLSKATAKTATVAQAQPRKIVSAQARKQKEDAERIERENRKLSERLQKQGPGKTSTGTAYNKADANSKAGSISTKPPVQEAKSSGAGPAQLAVQREEDLLQKLSDQYVTLKKRVGDEEADIRSLQNKLSNININIRRLETSLAKVKTVSTSASKSLVSGAVKPTGSVSVSASIDSSAQSKVIPRPENTSKDVPTNPSPKFELLVESSSSLKDVDDAEYKSLWEEYELVQRLRRGLLERVANAKKASLDAKESINQVIDRSDVAKRRLLRLRDEYGEFFSDEAKAAIETSNTKESKAANEDFVLFDRLQQLQQELVDVRANCDADSEIFQLESAREELLAVLSVLDKKTQDLHIRMDETMKERQLTAINLQSLAENTECTKRREFISKMTATRLRLERETRDSRLTASMREIDLQLVRLRMLAKERESISRDGSAPLLAVAAATIEELI